MIVQTVDGRLGFVHGLDDEAAQIKKGTYTPPRVAVRIGGSHKNILGFNMEGILR